MLYKTVRSLLFQQDPEKIHNKVFWAGRHLQKTKLLPTLKTYCTKTSPRLEQFFWGSHFINPIGLAAGFDKNGDLIPLLHALGFSFIEIGSITALPSPGNPQPRIFRLPKDEAIINRMGLNNDGARSVSQKLKKLSPQLPFAVNIAKTHSPTIIGNRGIDDFISSYKQLNNYGIYTALNISCPNTAEGKTFESDTKSLEALLEAITNIESSRPTLVKISPDLSSNEIHTLVATITKYKIDGFIIGNTTTNRSNLKTSPTTLGTIGIGGLSGAPLHQRSNQVIGEVYQQTFGKLPIIGAGGIMNTADVIDKIRHGASLVQLYTGLIYQGPFMVRKINLELDHFMQKNNITNISQLRGTHHGS